MDGKMFRFSSLIFGLRWFVLDILHRVKFATRDNPNEHQKLLVPDQSPKF